MEFILLFIYKQLELTIKNIVSVANNVCNHIAANITLQKLFWVLLK